MAGTGLTHDTLIKAFESRFDYLSARAVAAEVLDSAGIRKADAYDAGALARIGQAIETRVARPGVILGHLNASPAAAVEPKPAKKAEAHETVAEIAAPVAAPVAAAADAAAEAAPAEAAPAAEAAEAKHSEKKKEKK